MFKLRFIIIALFLSGCASTKPIIVNIHGEVTSSRENISVVKPVAFIKIFSIDGDDKYNIFPSGGMTNEYELEFLPGKHTLLIGYNNGSVWSRESIRFNIVLEKGRKYIIKPMTDGDIDLWVPQLIDVTERSQCWDLAVGTYFGPKGCD
jgi:hypothetical protein